MRDCFIEFPFGSQDRPEIGFRAGVARIRSNNYAIFCNRLSRASQACICDSEVIPRFEIIWIEGGCLLKASGCATHVAFTSNCDSEIAISERIIRFSLDGSLQMQY